MSLIKSTQKDSGFIQKTTIDNEYIEISDIKASYRTPVGIKKGKIKVDLKITRKKHELDYLQFFYCSKLTKSIYIDNNKQISFFIYYTELKEDDFIEIVGFEKFSYDVSYENKVFEERILFKELLVTDQLSNNNNDHEKNNKSIEMLDKEKQTSVIQNKPERIKELLHTVMEQNQLKQELIKTPKKDIGPEQIEDQSKIQDYPKKKTMENLHNLELQNTVKKIQQNSEKLNNDIQSIERLNNKVLNQIKQNHNFLCKQLEKTNSKLEQMEGILMELIPLKDEIIKALETKLSSKQSSKIEAIDDILEETINEHFQDRKSEAFVRIKKIIKVLIDKKFVEKSND